MNVNQQARVLDVGQCGMDHSAIRSLITSRFNAEVDRAMGIRDGLEAMRKTHYDLVLVNRMMDLDGGDGVELVRQAREDERLKAVPIMLVSNYAEAQGAAVAAGARPGFGKAGMYQQATLDRLAEFLPLKALQG